MPDPTNHERMTAAVDLATERATGVNVQPAHFEAARDLATLYALASIADSLHARAHPMISVGPHAKRCGVHLRWKDVEGDTHEAFCVLQVGHAGPHAGEYS